MESNNYRYDSIRFETLVVTIKNFFTYMAIVLTLIFCNKDISEFKKRLSGKSSALRICY